MTQRDAHLAAMVAAVRAGARVGRRAQQELVLSSSGTSKSDTSPVTVADYAVQAVISYSLFLAFPEIPLIAEEDASSLIQLLTPEALSDVCKRASEIHPAMLKDVELVKRMIGRGSYPGGTKGSMFFVLDPIDGTKGFLRGEQYVVALGLVDDLGMRVGVVGAPNLEPNELAPSPEFKGGLFEAVRGHGARERSLEETVEDVELPLTPTSALPKERARLVGSYERAHSDSKTQDKLLLAMGCSDDQIRKLDSQAKYCLIARGSADVYTRVAPFDNCIWDVAPGALIVEESGGRVSLADGSPVNYHLGRTIKSGIVLVSRRGEAALHDELVKALSGSSM